MKYIQFNVKIIILCLKKYPIIEQELRVGQWYLNVNAIIIVFLS